MKNKQFWKLQLRHLRLEIFLIFSYGFWVFEARFRIKPTIKPTQKQLPGCALQKRLAGNFIKKEAGTDVFPENFAKFLRTALLIKHFRWLLMAFPDMVLRNRANNRNYSTNLTTIRCGLNKSNIDQWLGETRYSSLI